MGASVSTAVEKISQNITEKDINKISESCVVKGGNAEINNGNIVIKHADGGSFSQEAKVTINAQCALKVFTEDQLNALAEAVQKQTQKQGGLNLGLSVNNIVGISKQTIMEALENYISAVCQMTSSSAIINNKNIEIEDTKNFNFSQSALVTENFKCAISNTSTATMSSSEASKAATSQSIEGLFNSQTIIIIVIVGGIVGVVSVLFGATGKKKSGQKNNNSFGSTFKKKIKY